MPHLKKIYPMDIPDFPYNPELFSKYLGNFVTAIVGYT